MADRNTTTDVISPPARRAPTEAGFDPALTAWRHSSNQIAGQRVHLSGDRSRIRLPKIGYRKNRERSRQGKQGKSG
jgi:hypothetical protein